MERALLAGGCFWCIESAFLNVPGVSSTQVGYAGGTTENPTYHEVCSGSTGHYEVTQVAFDPDIISYMQILDIFWRQIDPLDPEGQFYDRGSQYFTAIFYEDAHQKQLAEQSKADVQALFSDPVATQILPAKKFYPAEEEHQKYCCKQPDRYRNYARGHLGRLEELWQGKRIRHEDLRSYLTPEQYRVTQEEGTEPPFDNLYHHYKGEGIYVDVISGEPLFASVHKYDSGSGWPSFTEPLTELIELEDWKLGYARTEVRSTQSNAHLGHVFPDGPTGMRYCINSAALRFVPKSRLAAEGYGEFLSLFN